MNPKKRATVCHSCFNGLFFVFKPRATGLSGELSKACGDGQTLFEQEVVEGVAAECFQINLMLIIPKLVQGVGTD